MAGGGKLDFTEMEVDLDANVNISPIIASVGLNHNGTANINANLKGSKDQPIAMMMLGDKNAPVSLKSDMAMGASIKGSKEEPIAMMVLGDQRQPISANITGDKDRPISLAMEMTNLPRFSVNDIKEMMKPKIKISLPGHRQLCFKVLGQELFSVCYGGEGQLKIQPLDPEDDIDCQTPICDLDTRPFPQVTPGK
jgi:hypothetical protein